MHHSTWKFHKTFLSLLSILVYHSAKSPRIFIQLSLVSSLQFYSSPTHKFTSNSCISGNTQIFPGYYVHLPNQPNLQQIISYTEHCSLSSLLSYPSFLTSPKILLYVFLVLFHLHWLFPAVIENVIVLAFTAVNPKSSPTAEILFLHKHEQI